MQGRNRNYNAFETNAVDDFAIALLCGEAEFKVSRASKHSGKDYMELASNQIIDVCRRSVNWRQSDPLRSSRLEVHAGVENPQRSHTGHLIRHISGSTEKAVLQAATVGAYLAADIHAGGEMKRVGAMKEWKKCPGMNQGDLCLFFVDNEHTMHCIRARIWIHGNEA